MDSGNSGSLQSSSCGDDDFDSSFFHSSSTAVNGAAAAAAFPPPPSSYSYHQFLDSFYLDSSSLLPLDATAPDTAAPWPQCTPRPSPNCTTTTDTFSSLSVVPPSSLSPSSNNSLTSSTRSTVVFSPSSSVQPQEQSPAAAPTNTAAPAPPSARSSKKRTRASRRAPTTVLTTDTSNFRAMVQEFTGIPSPPFVGSASASSFVRSRLDVGAAGGLISPPSYLIRPFPQKFQGPFAGISHAAIPISSPASSTNTIASTGTATNSMSIANTITTSIPMATTNIVNPTSNNNYQLPPPGSVLGSQIEALVNSQNQMLNFQSFQQPQPRAKYTPSTVSSTAVPFTSSRLPSMPPSSAEYGSTNLLFPPGSLIGSPEGLRSSWGGHPAAPASVDRAQPPSAAGDYIFGSSQQRPVGSSTCKMNFSASGSSETTGTGRAAEKAKSSRSEGMVESWICSSD